jgi:hypothetical protein
MAHGNYNDIESNIGSPMQYPINFSTGDEYYLQTNKNDECADDEMSDNSIEYCECDDNDNHQQYQQYQQIQQQQQINYFIENLKFMSLNENKIILYQPSQPSQPPQDHCIIQMES